MLLARAVDVRRWLRDDRATPSSQRLQRDRTIGRELAASRPQERVLAWWSALAAAGHREADAPSTGDRVEAGRRLAVALLVALGVLFGAGVAGVALAYDGRHPVNLFTLLGILVGVPAVMLILTLLLLPGRMPGLGAVQGLAAGLNLGRWLGAGLDRWLGVDVFVPRGAAALVAGPFSRWQVVVFSQGLALGFFAGVLATTLLLVTFTDLAFGWTSTLDVDAGRVERWVSALAAPWAPWLPAAVPDAALVEASRYFRLEEDSAALDVARLGAWWPFVVMVIAVYGALPRLLLLLLGCWRLRRATVRLLLDDPEVTALLDRLQSPLVGLDGSADEEAAQAPRAALPPPRDLPAGEGLVLLIWNSAVDAATAEGWLAGHLGVRPAAQATVDTVHSEAEQRARLAAAAGALRGGPRRVLVMTKGWEPPLLEFNDFLGLTREVLGGGCSITVVPMSLGGGVAANDRAVWAGALARVRDPHLYVQDADA